MVIRLLSFVQEKFGRLQELLSARFVFFKDFDSFPLKK